MQQLKSWPRFFNEIINGNKKHELRRNDRRFEVGMHLLLKEYDEQKSDYTGRTQEVKITYITDSDEPCSLSEDALNSDYSILSIEVIK